MQAIEQEIASLRLQLQTTPQMARLQVVHESVEALDDELVDLQLELFLLPATAVGHVASRVARIRSGLSL